MTPRSIDRHSKLAAEATVTNPEPPARRVVKEDLNGGSREIIISRALREFSTHVVIKLDGGSSGGIGLALKPEQTTEVITALAETLRSHWDEKSEQDREELPCTPWEPTENMVHAAARALCHEKHHDWRYDPGNPKHDKWRARARRALRDAVNGADE